MSKIMQTIVLSGYKIIFKANYENVEGEQLMKNYKTTYDYPKAKGPAICPKCGFHFELPANFCPGCGNELDDTTKQGLKN
ncbi:hypothetical protein J7E38_13550 [Bacillus sp. ISL-35]|uniref:hypothetical protein n=1 Tax=Bacillus sp. ISL-35 TaxID=2819122 RepID=UPI001BE6BA0E|nr:hypothetical protein [Bacillus sp. ISL-35]MBT2680034.1 hypothetical protein [Bacillus sp. ISL-35]